MDNFLLNIGITAVLTALKESIKNPEKKKAIKPAMLKIASVIIALWGDESDFLETLHAKADYEKSRMQS